MKIRIIPFDPRTAAGNEWAKYHEFRRLRHEERDPEDPILEDETVEEMLKRQGPDSEILRFAVVDTKRPECQIGWLYFRVFREDSQSYKENKHLAWVDLAVLETHRKQGIGKRLLAKVAELANERDRSVIIVWSDEDDGKRFIRAINAQVAQETRESRLYLDQVDWQMVENWVREGSSRSPNTTLHWFTNRLDEAIVEDYCRILTEVINQEPRDGLDVGDRVITPESLRVSEGRIVEAGGTLLTAITVEADGDISGLTQMGYFPDQETMVHQFMTGVKDVCRGRGLGKWLKAAMLVRVRNEFPQVKMVVTGNATSNAAMLSINERLGFKLHREGITAQITLESLESYLNRLSTIDSRTG